MGTAASVQRRTSKEREFLERFQADDKVYYNDSMTTLEEVMLIDSNETDHFEVKTALQVAMLLKNIEVVKVFLERGEIESGEEEAKKFLIKHHLGEKHLWGCLDESFTKKIKKFRENITCPESSRLITEPVNIGSNGEVMATVYDRKGIERWLEDRSFNSIKKEIRIVPVTNYSPKGFDDFLEAYLARMDDLIKNEEYRDAYYITYREVNDVLQALFQAMNPQKMQAISDKMAEVKECFEREVFGEDLSDILSKRSSSKKSCAESSAEIIDEMVMNPLMQGDSRKSSADSSVNPNTSVGGFLAAETVINPLLQSSLITLLRSN